MKIINHAPLIKTYGNGFQITFPNRYTLIAKNGLGAECTQLRDMEDVSEMFLTSRFGGNHGPDIEVEIYDTKTQNITSKFTNESTATLGFVTPMELVNLLYIVSNLK